MPSSPVSDDGADQAAVEEVDPAPAGEAQAALARAEDRHKRALADLDNYRKRSAQEIERRVGERSEQIISDWLEAIDSVERAMHMQGPTNEIAVGLRAVMEQMEAILDRQGVRRIGKPGDRFDPELHEAVAVVDTDEVPSRTVVEVARSGYALGDKVLRPAQVVVSSSGDGGSREEVEV
jgi:molecular chaperone GrpE